MGLMSAAENRPAENIDDATEASRFHAVAVANRPYLS
jgi:hypothetical protein